jgi:hypothetical protein
MTFSWLANLWPAAVTPPPVLRGLLWILETL